MIDLFGSNYYIDLDVIDKLVTIDSKEISKTKRKRKDEDQDEEFHPKTIDGVKFEMINYFINVVMESSMDDDDIDETLGFDRAISKTSIGFKLAFNTLLKYNILKEI